LCSTLEILGSLCQVGVAHQVLTILELAAFLKESFSLRLRIQSVRVCVFIHMTHRLRHVIPIDLKLGDSWFFCKNVSSESLNYGSCRGLLVELNAIVLYVDVVAHAQELLAVLIRTGE